MFVPKPDKKEISFKGVEWGSREFNELVKQVKEQEQKQRDYEQAVEFVTKIMEGY